MELMFLVLILGQFWYINYRLEKAEKKFKIDYNQWKEEFSRIEDTVIALLTELDQITRRLQLQHHNNANNPLHEANLNSIDDQIKDEDSFLKEEKKNQIYRYFREGYKPDDIAHMLAISLGEVELYLNLAHKEEQDGR